MKAKATLLYDTYAGKNFGGSCGIVTHFFRKAFRKLGYLTEDIYIPVSDKTSTIELSKSNNSPNKDIHFFFEELFHRCKKDAEYKKHPNISFFNLPFFSEIENHCKADSLLFNSKYLMSCFLAEAYSKNLIPPRVDWMPLPLPLLDFRKGYPSNGTRVNASSLKLLNKEAFVGHALRPIKQDYFATLAIVYHLNRLAKKHSLKPFILLISGRDLEFYKTTIRKMSIPKKTLDYFYPMPHMNNKSIITIMKNSRFSLCYDVFWEAFGYYLIESVYCGSPVFTNGASNIRHILPLQHGIYVNETLKMHFGSIQAKIDAYAPVAEKILHAMNHQKEVKTHCKRGAKYIIQNYSSQALTKRLNAHLQLVIDHHGSKACKKTYNGKFKIELSPCLRLVDWEKGQFVTDQGAFEAKRFSKKWFNILKKGYIKAKDLKRTKLDTRVLTILK